ncbi:hypothetical protein JXA80_00165 [bacterium]|nr:hypothetical protein [candidate division CSSED10-310 bacterium]
MENMPLMILLGVGVLLVAVVVFFVISQKKRDRSDALETRKMLDKLDIDIKDASEDIDDTVASIEASVAESAGIASAGQPVKRSVPESRSGARHESDSPSKITREPNAIPGKHEPEVSAVDTADDAYERAFDELETSAGGMLDDDDAIIKSDGFSDLEDDEGMDSARGFIVDLDDALDLTTNDEDGELAKPSAAMHLFETQSDKTNASDMSELDALFEANTDVEDLVLSRQSPQEGGMDEPEIDDDFFLESEKPIAPSRATPHQPAAPVKEPPTAPPRTATPPPKASQAPAPAKAAQPPAAPAKAAQPPAAPAKAAQPPATPPEPAEMDPEELKAHEKAKRIARVIVNDIRNYNPEKLAEGIRMGNIMKTLGKEVERGRLLYIKRVPMEITRESNYYKEALIKILADGRSDLLGL